MPSTTPTYCTPSKRASGSKLDHALALAELGFAIIPLHENGKKPAISDWPRLASRDAGQIQDWWESPAGGLLDRNIGIATGADYRGEHLVVVDLDQKKGKDGLAALEALAEQCDAKVPRTRTVRTASGGLHLYFRSPSPIKCSAGTLGEGIDVRGTGGQVVAPGSTIDGRAYTLDDDAPIAVCPDWLLTKMTKHRPDAIPTGPGIERVDGWALGRALNEIDGEPIPEGGRDIAVNTFLFNMHGDGLPDDLRRGLAYLFDARRCVPPLGRAVVDQKADSVARTQKQQGRNRAELEFAEPGTLPEVPPRAPGKNEPADILDALDALDGDSVSAEERGTAAAEYLQALQARGLSLDVALELAGRFDAVRCDPPLGWKAIRKTAWAAYELPDKEDGPEPAEAPERPKGLGIPSPEDGDVTRLLGLQPPPREFLVEGLIPAGEVGALIGAGGVGKSVFALGLCMAVKSGGPVCGHAGWQVKTPRDVLYLHAEDSHEEAWRRLHAILEEEERHVWDGPAALDRLKGGRRFVFHPLEGRDARLTTRGGQFTQAVREITEAAAQFDDLGLIVLDPAVSFLGGEENSNEDVQLLITACRRIAKQSGAAVLIVHHSSKSAAMNGRRDASAGRGASAFEAGIRWALVAARMGADEAKAYDLGGCEPRAYLGIENPKANYGPEAELAWFQRSAHGPALWYHPPRERAEASAEEEYRRVVDFALRVIAEGREHSKRSFSERYSKEIGIGQKKIRQYVEDALDTGELVLVKSTRRQGGRQEVLAAPAI